MEEKEQMIKQWFSMWLEGKDTGIEDVFAEDITYIESWGPQYHGVAKVKQWFTEWNTRGRVLKWDIKQFFHKDNKTVVQWYFQNRMNDGVTEAFDGMSLIEWTREGKIRFLQEFGCNENRYDPYQDGQIPLFREEKVRWF